MSSASPHSVPTDWEANERSSNDPGTLGPGDIIWARISMKHVIEKTETLRERYEGNLTPQQAREIGRMDVATGSSRKRHSGCSFVSEPKRSNTVDSDVPDKAAPGRPCLVLFTCQRGSDLAYISAPLTRLRGRTPEQSTFSQTQGFYDMIYPVSPGARFDLPPGPDGASRPQKLLPIPEWETRSKNQYCALGALMKVNKEDATPDNPAHRLRPDVLRQAQREAMGLMTPLERSRLHI
ncbi:hypothetical protein FRC00_014331, partial [Tulasnella sp. 408]